VVLLRQSLRHGYAVPPPFAGGRLGLGFSIAKESPAQRLGDCKTIILNDLQIGSIT